jgi:hypothetical protein
MNQAEATHKLLIEWKVDANVVRMSFDTTSANTSVHNGACVVLEKLLGRNLLNFACRQIV